MEHEERIRLRRLIGKHFSAEELKLLVFDLEDVSYDDLPGDSKAGKILGLIEYLERRGKEGGLLGLLAKERPNVDWPGAQAQQGAEAGQPAQPAAPEFGRLALGDKTVEETVNYLQLMFDKHDRSTAGVLPTGFLAEMGRLFRRYTFCKSPEECDTQVWGTRLLAIIETHDVLTTVDEYLFQIALEDYSADMATLRDNLRQVADALREYGQTLTAYFEPALDWQEAMTRLSADGYNSFWNDLEERKLTRAALDDDIRRRCDHSFWRLREVLGEFDALDARC